MTGSDLPMVGLSEDDAAQELKAVIEDLRTQEQGSPAEREGLLGWCDNWHDDFNTDPKACEILVDAMARFMLHLKAGGSSTWEAFATFLRESGEQPTGP